MSGPWMTKPFFEKDYMLNRFSTTTKEGRDIFGIICPVKAPPKKKKERKNKPRHHLGKRFSTTNFLSSRPREALAVDMFKSKNLVHGKMDTDDGKKEHLEALSYNLISGKPLINAPVDHSPKKDYKTEMMLDKLVSKCREDDEWDHLFQPKFVHFDHLGDLQKNKEIMKKKKEKKKKREIEKKKKCRTLSKDVSLYSIESDLSEEFITSTSLSKLKYDSFNTASPSFTTDNPNDSHSQAIISDHVLANPPSPATTPHTSTQKAPSPPLPPPPPPPPPPFPPQEYFNMMEKHSKSNNMITNSRNVQAHFHDAQNIALSPTLCKNNECYNVSYSKGSNKSQNNSNVSSTTVSDTISTAWTHSYDKSKSSVGFEISKRKVLSSEENSEMPCQAMVMYVSGILSPEQKKSALENLSESKIYKQQTEFFKELRALRNFSLPQLIIAKNIPKFDSTTMNSSQAMESTENLDSSNSSSSNSSSSNSSSSNSSSSNSSSSNSSSSNNPRVTSSYQSKRENDERSRKMTFKSILKVDKNNRSQVHELKDVKRNRRLKVNSVPESVITSESMDNSSSEMETTPMRTKNNIQSDLHKASEHILNEHSIKNSEASLQSLDSEEKEESETEESSSESSTEESNSSRDLNKPDQRTGAKEKRTKQNVGKAMVNKTNRKKSIESVGATLSKRIIRKNTEKNGKVKLSKKEDDSRTIQRSINKKVTEREIDDRNEKAKKRYSKKISDFNEAASKSLKNKESFKESFKSLTDQETSEEFKGSDEDQTPAKHSKKGKNGRLSTDMQKNEKGEFKDFQLKDKSKHFSKKSQLIKNKKDKSLKIDKNVEKKADVKKLRKNKLDLKKDELEFSFVKVFWDKKKNKNEDSMSTGEMVSRSHSTADLTNSWSEDKVEEPLKRRFQRLRHNSDQAFSLESSYEMIVKSKEKLSPKDIQKLVERDSVNSNEPIYVANSSMDSSSDQSSERLISTKKKGESRTKNYEQKAFKNRLFVSTSKPEHSGSETDEDDFVEMKPSFVKEARVFEDAGNNVNRRKRYKDDSTNPSSLNADVMSDASSVNRMKDFIMNEAVEKVNVKFVNSTVDGDEDANNDEEDEVDDRKDKNGLKKVYKTSKSDIFSFSNLNTKISKKHLFKSNSFSESILNPPTSEFDYSAKTKVFHKTQGNIYNKRLDEEANKHFFEKSFDDTKLLPSRFKLPHRKYYTLLNTLKSDGKYF